MRGQVRACCACGALIVWGIRNARPHPYNAVFDSDGIARQGDSHMSTCPEIACFLPRHGKTGYARAARKAADVARWRASCRVGRRVSVRTIHWSGISVYDVPERHARPIALKLAERGGPFRTWEPADLFPFFNAIAVRKGLVMWVMLKDAVFNEIHGHLHGFWVSVFSDMSERAPVKVAGYQLEPVSVLPKLPYQQVRHFSLAESYTLGKGTV